MIEVNELQPQKAYDPISVMVDAKVALDKAEQFINAPLPIEINPFLVVSLVIEEQFKKA